MGDEASVGLREVTAAEESAVGGERGGMRGFEDQVVFCVNEWAFGLRVAAP